MVLGDLFKPAPAALILVALFASFIFFNSTVDFWTYSTSPTSGGFYKANSVIGYSWILDGRIFHKENWPSIPNLHSFLNGTPTNDMYAVRPMYPLLGSVFSPFVGIRSALLLVNIVAWGVAAYCAVRLTNLLTDSAIAAWIAAAFIVFGEGYWLHLTDYSAHMLSNCGYVVSVYVLAKIGTAEKPPDLRNQVIATVTLSAMALTYNTGLALLAAYTLFAILSGSWRAPIVTLLIVLVAQRAWPYFYCWSLENGTNMQSTEGRYLAEALSRWWVVAHQPAALFEVLGRLSLQVVASDPLNLAVVLTCVAGILTGRIRRRLEWFLFVAGITPVLAALPWMIAATARGYIANAGFGVLAVLAAVVIGRCGRAARLVAVSIIIVQVGWLASQSLGNIHPLTTYTIGANNVGDFFSGFGRSTITTASLTGHEAVPQRIGGSEPVGDAGGLQKTRVFILGVNPTGWTLNLHGWAYRLYVFVPVMIGIMLLVTRRKTAGALLAAAYLLPPLVAHVRPPERFNVIVTENPLPTPAKLVTQQVTLSKQAWEALQTASARQDQVELFSGMLVSTKFEAELCGQRIVDKIDRDSPFTHERSYKIDPDMLERALRVADCDRGLRVRIEALETAGLTGWSGWQMAGLPLRRLTIDGSEISNDEAVSWPAMELRIGRPLGPWLLKTTYLFF